MSTTTDFWDQLNAEPQDTIHHRIVGPPGCGKTTYLTRQAPRAAAKYGSANIAVCSLTRAAAAVIAGRDSVIPRENVGTLHAHCYRALDRPLLAETADGVRAWNEACGAASWRLSRASLASDDPIAELTAIGDEGDRLLSKLNLYRARMTDPRLWAPEVIAFAARWKAWKDETGRMDFTDTIEACLERIDTMPHAPKVIFCDEAQDISRLEHQLLEKWGDAADQVVVVGDPDQALYTWRGADPKAVFGTNIDDVIVLSQSYRVPAAVHEAAVAMIDRIPDRLPVEYHPAKDPQTDRELRGLVEHAPLQWADAQPVIAAIEDEISHGRQVMVLASCGYMLTPLVRQLKTIGLPFHNPYRASHPTWNPLGSSTRRLLALLRPDPRAWPEDHRMWSWQDLRAFTEPMQAVGALRRGAKTHIAARCKAESAFGADADDVQVSIAELQDLFVDDALDRLAAFDVDWWADALKHAERQRLTFSIECYRRHGHRGLRDEPKLIVGTVHSVKGGEADTVILFPDLSTAGYYDGLKLAGEPHDSVIRLFYVGMTRAKDKLILAQPSSTEAIGW